MGGRPSCRGKLDQRLTEPGFPEDQGCGKGIASRDGPGVGAEKADNGGKLTHPALWGESFIVFTVRYTFYFIFSSIKLAKFKNPFSRTRV